jgi:hypothetical protein
MTTITTSTGRFERAAGGVVSRYVRDLAREGRPEASPPSAPAPMFAATGNGIAGALRMSRAAPAGESALVRLARHRHSRDTG